MQSAQAAGWFRRASRLLEGLPEGVEHGYLELHAAEATVIADDYAGLGVHQAPRVGALAEAGEIVVTCETLEGTSIGYPVSEERAVALKGIARPVRVASIEWRPGSR